MNSVLFFLLLIFPFNAMVAMDSENAATRSQIQTKCNRPGCTKAASVGAPCHDLRMCGFGIAD